MDDRHTLSGDFIFGPFSSVSEFHDYLHSGMKKYCGDAAFETCRSEYRPFDNHRVVFTHADLQPKNILVDAINGRLIGVIDWEMAGWWPAYWEYRKAWNDSGLKDRIGEVLEVYTKELALDEEHEYH
jgi:thiamine kinase-like enzyme